MIKGQRFRVVSNGRDEPTPRWHRFKRGDIVTFNTVETHSGRPLHLHFIKDNESQWLALDMVVPLFDVYLKELER